MKHYAKAVAVTLFAGMGSALLVAPAYAGADEAHMWSFMSGAASTTAAAPASDGVGEARAEYQGDGFTVLRHNTHQYLDCTSHGGGKLSCKNM